MQTATAGAACRRFAINSEKNASSIRYADDLAFSGGQALDEVSRGFVAGVGEIVGEVGYTLNPTKTRRMGRGGPQRVTGFLVNDHLNVDRHTFDVLKAILTNCCRDGVVSQNRNGHSNFREHLNGRVTWVENVNPQRGAKLRKTYEEIKWQAT